MRRPNSSCLPGLLTAIVSSTLSIAFPYTVTGTELLLTWRDNSANEEGFRLERRLGANPYQLHATLGPNVTSFLEHVGEQGKAICYRVRAFNAAGASGFTNQVCAFTLTVDERGAGTGRITGPGINCPPDCSESFPEHASIALDAHPDAGSMFLGWSGDPDCIDGGVSMDSSRTCLATFERRPPGTSIPESTAKTTGDAANSEPRHVTLTVARAHTLSEHGTGEGHITSQPAGIDCGSACSAPYEQSTVVTLRAFATPDSQFVGWNGAPCPNAGPCVLNLTEDTSIIATFAPRTAALTVMPYPGGVILGPGIDCGSVCKATYRHGAEITLRAVPENAFAAWENTTCPDSPTCTIELDSDRAVSGRFKVTSYIGVFRPKTGEWFLDDTGTGEWQRAHRVGPWDPTQGRGTPFVGNWTAGSDTSLAMYEPALQTWYLDNGNDRWEGCEVDTCATFAPEPAGESKPVAGDWHRMGQSDIGSFNPLTGSWYLDNGNSRWDGCDIDLCYAGEHVEIIDFNRTTDALEKEMTALDGQLRTTSDRNAKKQLKRARKRTKKELKRSRKRLKKFLKLLKKAERARRKAGMGESAQTRALRVGQQDPDHVEPVTASFNRGGPSVLGAFYRSNGAWEFDTNGNGEWEGCNIDLCFPGFAHQDGDVPVAGDWNGIGASKIGLFRSASGEWLLDTNGNGRWDGCEIDACLGPFGSSGDIPVVGKW